MAGDTLHEFDLQLCDYVASNVQRHLDDPEFHCLLEEELWPEELLQYLRDGIDPDVDQDRQLLSAREMAYLLVALRDGPAQMDRSWSADQHLHRRYVATVKEVRNALSLQVADDWSRQCVGFATGLEAAKLKLSGAIEIVTDWTYALRQLLRAMGATKFLPVPEGSIPTPTNPTVTTRSGAPSASTFDSLLARERDDIARMRQAIRTADDGRDTKPGSLVSAAGINRQRGRKALRWLECRGEYQGFAREQAQRYKEGKANER
jgi:hypothetical protein